MGFQNKSTRFTWTQYYMNYTKYWTTIDWTFDMYLLESSLVLKTCLKIYKHYLNLHEIRVIVTEVISCLKIWILANLNDMSNCEQFQQTIIVIMSKLALNMGFVREELSDLGPCSLMHQTLSCLCVRYKGIFSSSLSSASYPWKRWMKSESELSNVGKL